MADDKLIAAMAVACIAEELGTIPEHLKVVSFREVPDSPLEAYIKENNINYHKYQLGDESL